MTVPASTGRPSASSTLSRTIGTAPSIVVTIPLLPPTANHIWVHTRGNHFRTPEYLAFIEAVAFCVPRRMQKLEGPIAVSIDLHFAKHSSCMRSDIDNRVKAALDALARAGAFLNDSQIVELYVVKQTTGTDEVVVAMDPVP